MQLFQHSIFIRGIRVLIAWQLAVSLLWGQGFLKLSAIDGEGAFNDSLRKIGHPPSIRVVDESDNPIKRAEVTFTFPMVGPGATFRDGGTTGVSFSDENGVARSPAFTPNSTEGRFSIQVTARYQAKTGRMVISQSNTLAGGTTISQANKGKSKLWIVLLAAGGAVGGIVAVHGASRSEPTVIVPPTILSTGTIAVGGPR